MMKDTFKNMIDLYIYTSLSCSVQINELIEL